MNVVFVSAAWRRFDVTRLALAQRARLCDALAERGLRATAVIVADDENLEIAQEFGFATYEQRNDLGLGVKFNHGIEFACTQLDAEYVVLIGSDDWVHESVFDLLPEKLTLPELPTPEKPVVIGRAVPEVIAGSWITICDLRSGRARHCHARGQLGVIPWVLPREALEPSGFRPIPEMQKRGIDGALWRGLKIRPKWTLVDPQPFARVDFKSDTNLNSYEAISDSIGEGDEFTIESLRAHYPGDLVEQALTFA